MFSLFPKHPVACFIIHEAFKRLTLDKTPGVFKVDLHYVLAGFFHEAESRYMRGDYGVFQLP